MGRGAELRRGLGLEPLGGSMQVTNPTPTLTLTQKTKERRALCATCARNRRFDLKYNRPKCKIGAPIDLARLGPALAGSMAPYGMPYGIRP